MTKLEKVIKAFECWSKMAIKCDSECPYKPNDEREKLVGECDFQTLCTDALELLKEQEPRVLTLKEVLSQSWDYCYIEAEYCTTSIVLERQTRGDKEYGKTWRCWTARPTDEQRKAVKWE